MAIRLIKNWSLLHHFPSLLPSLFCFRCIQIEDEQMLRSMKSCINETLTTVAQYFGQLIELVLTHEAQVSLQYKNKSNNNNKHLHKY